MNLIFAATGMIVGISASGPLIAGTLAATSVGALAIAFWRNAIAAVVMGVGPATRTPSEFRRLGGGTWLWCATAALALALHFICFILALSMTSVAAATALVCLQSAWIAVIGLFRGARYGWHVILGLTISLSGVVAITGLDMGSSPTAFTGDLLAIAGGLLAAIYTIAGARARATLSTGVYTSVCYGACAMVVGVIAWLSGTPLTGFEASGWLGIAAITLAAQLIGHSSMNYLVGHMSALLVSMLILLEIPGAALLAAIFLNEALPPGTYLGLVLIMAGLAVVILGQRSGRSRARGNLAPPPALGAD